jgi:hypothetical protein
MGRYEIKDKNPHACHSAAVKVVAAERNLQDEGEEVAAWERFVARVPGSERYSVLQCCGVAVKRKKVKAKVKVEVERMEVGGEMPSDKYSIMDNGHGSRTRESMSKFKVGNPWKTGKKKSERRGIWATGQKALNRSDKGLLHKPGKAQSIFPLDIRKPV